MQEFIAIVTNYYVGILLVALSSAISLLYLQFKALRYGMKAMLKNSIIAIYNKSLDKGYVPIYERDNIQQMYCAYRDLKGNGNVKELVDELMRIPTRHKGEVD